MTDILSSPVCVCHRSEQVYFFDGVASADIIGPPEERKAVLALVGQAQRMATLLAKVFDEHNCHVPPDECSTCGPIEECLRDAGVWDPSDTVAP